MIRVVHPGSRIRMLTFSHPGSRIQGSKRHSIPDPGSATLVTGVERACTLKSESDNNHEGKKHVAATVLY